MTEIYAVTSRQRDSYSVVALFTDRERAEAIQALRDPDSDIEVFELDPQPPDWLPEGHVLWNARGHIGDGQEEIQECPSVYFMGFPPPAQPPELLNSVRLLAKADGCGSLLCVHLTAPSRQDAMSKAVAAFNEYLTSAR
jgi:hypothetical protein